MPDQKPKPKDDSIAQYFQALYGRAQTWLAGVLRDLEKAREVAKNNYELGLSHLNAGHIQDAIFRFKIVTWLNPQHADAWYRLGCAYLADNKRTLAIKSLQTSLKLKPGNEEAIFMLAVAGGATAAALPRRMPVSLAKAHFDQLARDVDREELDTYKEKACKLLTDAVRAAMVAGRIDHEILELGVWTGQCGALLKPVASRITGVDISPAMLAEALKRKDAQGKKAYDALIERELQAYILEVPTGSYDVVLAPGCLSYLGDLQPLFIQIAQVLKPGGLFAFLADPMEGDDFRFDPESGRFRFSAIYLRALAAANGLKEIKLEQAAAYPDKKAWLGVFGK